MYKHYFGFADAPFSIAPDPRYLYLSDEHREAVAHLVYGIGDHGGFVVLTGEVGTGKTTVCRCLLQQVPAHVDVAVVVNPRLSVDELLQTVCEELGVPLPEGPLSGKQLIDELNHFLLRTHARGRNAILIIDEAQNLAPEVLEQLRLLTNLETNERKLLQLILLGQPELNDLLARPQLRQLSQRITARHHLRPLSLAETERYVAHRLAVAGARSNLFTAGAIRRIHRYSDGIPRLINVLCDRALLGVYATQGAIVDDAMVRRAVREISPPRRLLWTPAFWRQLGLQRHGLALVAALLLIAVALTLLNRDGGDSAIDSDPESIVSLSNTAVGSRVAAESGAAAESTIADHLDAALRQLYERWGAAPADPPVCRSDTMPACVGVQAFDRRQLERVRLPALLTLRGNDWQQLVLLESLDDSAARVHFAGRDWQVPWRDVERYWTGEARLLVDAPVGRLPLAAGGSGPLVGWLDTRLHRHFEGDRVRWQQSIDDYSPKLTQSAGKAAWLNSHFLALHQQAPATIYSDELVAQVKRFQQEQGLPVDGVVTLDTVLSLARAASAVAPSAPERKS